MLIVTKNAVYANHELNGIMFFLKNSARGPAENDIKLGNVNSAVNKNCANVIRGPFVLYKSVQTKDIYGESELTCAWPISSP